MKYYNRAFCTSRYDIKGWLNMYEDKSIDQFPIYMGTERTINQSCRSILLCVHVKRHEFSAKCIKSMVFTATYEEFS
jgi:hypothetical protein